MFQTIKFSITGVAPLIMHSSRMADPQDPFTRELKRLTSNKRVKGTDEGIAMMGRVEWCGGLYHSEGPVEIGDGDVAWDSSIRVVIPASNLSACIIDGAKAAKLGKAMKAAVFVPEDAPLEYRGPKDINALMKDTQFISRKAVKNNGRATVMRTRPIFRQWGATFDVQYNSDSVDEENVLEALVIAGRTCGIGDWKPQHGRFEVAKL